MRISGIFAMGGSYDHDRYDYQGFYYPYGGFHRAGFPDERNGYRRPDYDPRYDQDSIYVKRYH
jgi:hypothetical protein